MTAIKKHCMTTAVVAARNVAMAMGVFVCRWAADLLLTPTTIADWTFETSDPPRPVPFRLKSAAGSATGSHAGLCCLQHPGGQRQSAFVQFQHLGCRRLLPVSGQYHRLQQYQPRAGTKLRATRDQRITYSSTARTERRSPISIRIRYSPMPPQILSGMRDDPPIGFHHHRKISRRSAALNNAPTVYFRITDADTISANGGTVGTRAARTGSIT